MTQQQQIITWLKKYNAYKAGIENLTELSEDICNEGYGIDYSKDYISPTNSFSSTVENKVIKMDKLNIDSKIKSMQNVVHSIDKALNSLNDIEKVVIVDKYIKGRYYFQICYDLHISERWAKVKRSDALEKMRTVIFGDLN